MSTIGSRIRNRRIRIGLSVDELAARLGKNRATVYRYEGDEIGNFPISVIEPLANALQTTPAYLMGWTDEEEAAIQEDSGLAEIVAIFNSLTPDNRSKLLELSRLFLNAQHNNGETR